MDAEKSHRAVVPKKGGNSPEGPRGGKGASGYGTVGGKDDGDTRPRKRLNETTADSDAGAANARGGDHLPVAPHRRQLDEEAYRRTRKDGATGVDGQTAKDYEANLGANLRQLLDRAKAGTYRAPPVKRVHIPKDDGKSTRPIGIPTFEDKVLQRAAVMALEAVYEQDFKDCSHGFRPGRSAHQALGSFWKQMMDMGGGWVVEVDIKKFFDTLDHRHLQTIVRQRVRDGVLLRLIGKWLNAGVMEEGALSYPDAGTPQGGVISPLLANVYLHEVLDTWFEAEVQPRLRGRAFLVRYADDCAPRRRGREASMAA